MINSIEKWALGLIISIVLALPASALASESALTNAEFIKLMLNSDNFNPESITEIRYSYPDVPADLAPYTEKLVNLRVLDYQEDALFKPNAQITLPRALEYTLKYKGVIVPKKVEDLEKFKSKFKNLNPNSAIAPIFEKAYEYGLYKPKNGQVSIFANVDTKYASGILEIKKLKASTSKLQINEADKFNILANVWNKLNTEYYYADTVDPSKLMYGAISGMVNSLNDPYTNYKTPADATLYREDLGNELEGIGASFTVNDAKQIVVVTPLNGSPAEKAGLKPKDILIKIDDQKIEGLELAQVTKLMKGIAGTTVKITLLRDNQEINLNIVRAKINIPSLSTEITNDEIVIFKINNFGAGVETAFKKALSQLKPNQLKGVVIDVRKNPGGYVSSAVHVASHFTKKDELLAQVKYSGQKTKSEKSYGYAELLGKRVYILVDSGTASAAEILAAALKEKAGATIIGEKTFGKGTVQELLTYSDDSLLKMTVANWFTPKGTAIDKVGIQPDLKIITTDKDKKLNNDPVLNKALQELRK